MTPIPASFLALDVETTGFSPADDRVLEVGWVVFDGGAAAAAHVERVDPRRSIPPVVTALTGIRDDDVRGKPRFRAIAERLVASIAAADCVVAYNAPFDRRFVSAELARAGLTLPDVPWVDVLALARAIEPRAGSFSLVSACARHAVALPHAHRAVEDARAAGELFVRLAGGGARRTVLRHVPARALRRPAPAERLPTRMKARVLALFT